jgi:hypothetical protein
LGDATLDVMREILELPPGKIEALRQKRVI